MLKDPIQYGHFKNGESQLGKMEQNKFYALTNLDIHTEPGLAQPQKATAVESTTVTELCYSAIDPNGIVYFASSTSGKIWKRTTAGVYSLVKTNANGAHRGCQYFNGRLWYWTASKLGHFNLVSTFTDTFATFTNGKAQGSVEANNSLIIADGRYLARVDAANAFSANEFAVPAQYNIRDIMNIGDDVLVTTIVSASVSYYRVFLWNTVDSSWTTEDEVFEQGGNAFMQLDNIRLNQAGTQGRLYYWTGGQMSYFGKIRGATTSTVQRECTVSYNGRALIGIGTKIYSIHREDMSFPYAICAEYTTAGTIFSLIVQGQNLLASTSSGIEKIGTTYATAIIETPEAQANISEVHVLYDTYPAGFGISTSIDGAAYVAQTPVVDTNKKSVTFNGGLPHHSTCMVKVTLTPDGTNIPKIKNIILR